MFLKKTKVFSEGFRTIASMKNCPPTPKLTLTETLTLTAGQFSSGSNCPDTFSEGAVYRGSSK